jgi:uncharacterized protein involved in outer membrane biogenesis
VFQLLLHKPISGFAVAAGDVRASVRVAILVNMGIRYFAMADARMTQPDALAALRPDLDLDPRNEHAALRERKGTLAGLVADGTMSRADVKDAVERLNERLAEIDRAGRNSSPRGPTH